MSTNVQNSNKEKFLFAFINQYTDRDNESGQNYISSMFIKSSVFFEEIVM